MQLNLCDSILREYGYFALAAELYNYGEPLINPNFPEMVRRAKRMGLHTVTSSNLSLRFDVEAVVQSGLDSLLMSVDGASRETLGIYRRRARFEREGWVQRMQRLGVEEETSRTGEDTCDWLYQSLTFDAHGCVRPCCLPPSSHRHLVFSHAADGPADVLNSPCAVESRLLLTDKREYGGSHKSDESMESYCAECAAPPGLMNAVAKAGQAHLQRLDRDRVLSIDACRALTNWGGS